MDGDQLSADLTSVLPSLGLAGVVERLDALPHDVVFWDRDLTCRFANTAAALAFGRRPETMRGATMADLLGDQALPHLEQHIDAALSGRSSTLERVLLQRDHQIRRYHVTYTPHVVDGTVAGFSTLRVDLTDEMQVHSRLVRDSEQRARLAEREAFMNAVGAIVLGRMRSTLDAVQHDRPLTDEEAGRVVSALRESIEELRPWARPSEDQGGVREPAEAPVILAAGWTSRADDEAGLVSPHPQESGPAPLEARVAGPVEHVHLLFMDLPVVVTEWDTSFRLRHANHAAVRFARQWAEHEVVVGRHVWDIVGDRFWADVREYAEAAMAGQGCAFMRLQTDIAGHTHHFHVRYLPHVVRGEVVGAYAYATDVTDRIEAAEALAAAKAAFAALDERRAIEAALHGAVLQELFAASLTFSMGSVTDPDKATRRLHSARDSIRTIIDRLSTLTIPANANGTHDEPTDSSFGAPG